MPLPDGPQPYPTTGWRVLPVACLVATAGASAALALSAPEAARTWAAASAAVGGVLATLLAWAAGRSQRRLGERIAAAQSWGQAQDMQLARYRSETSELASVELPRMADAFTRAATPSEPDPAAAWRPSEPYLESLVQSVESTLRAAGQRIAAEQAAQRQLQENQARFSGDLRQVTEETLPEAVRRMREGASLNTVRQELKPDSYSDPSVQELLEATLRELAVSERRSTAGQAASARALNRVQAQAMSMLADLREMQNRHGEEVLGDLLKLDHSTSQLGLLTDRLAVLMGGRGSRGWQKPIAMQSILRGAVGRIAAYRRVTLNCSSEAAVSGFAAEGVMHLLAELMDNATKFSPPIDQVHVYVEERAAGMVVTIEDSGLKMADAAMRRAEEAVSGGVADLAALQGTRLGLAVVGRLAQKFDIGVSFRPSSRGGTGVVVLLPSQLLSQQRASALDADYGSGAMPRRPRAAAPDEGGTVLQRVRQRTTEEAPAPPPPGSREPSAVPAPASVREPEADPSPVVAPADGSSTTPNGLPVRPPGHTMAVADRTRPDVGGPAPERPAARDVGARFGAFHQSRRTADTDSAEESEPDTDS